MNGINERDIMCKENTLVKLSFNDCNTLSWDLGSHRKGGILFL